MPAALLALFLAAPLAAQTADVGAALRSAGQGAGDMAAVQARTVASPADCVPFQGKGCVYDGGEGALLLYFRGHLNGSGNITGPERILASSRQALESYGIRKAADQLGLTALVTGSSHIPVTRKDVERLEAALGRKFPLVLVAAHSGGYVGLSASLDGLPRVDSLSLLDCFYGSDIQTALASKVAAREEQGAACRGFATPHNLKRYRTYFQPLSRCAVEARPSDAEHESRVSRCLPHYLAGRACPD